MDTFWQLWGLAFLAGLWSFWSPCVLPVIPAYGASLAVSENRRISSAFLKTLFFSAGVCAPFFLAGLWLNSLDLEQPLIFFLAGILSFIFGVMKLIKRSADCPVRRTGLKNSFKPGLGACFILGLISSFGWTACAAPLITALIGLGAGREGLSGSLTLIAVYSLGLLAPFFVLTLSFMLFKRKVSFLKGSVISAKLGGAALAGLGLWLIWSNWPPVAAYLS
jgi:cytochrome c-type biogenesis protein